MSQKKSLSAIGEDRAIEALVSTQGNVSKAAEKLGVNRRTVSRWIAQHPHLRMLVNEQRDRLLDKAEENVFEAVMQGDLKMSMFVLRTLGKNRGYAERKEVNQLTPRPIQEMPTEDIVVMYRAAVMHGEEIEGLNEEDREMLRGVSDSPLS